MPTLVSYILLTYNQSKTIEPAFKGLLAQQYTPLEIVVSDDSSQDDTFEIIKDIAASYKGPHSIKLNRNEVNLGINGNYNKAFTLTEGELILISAGDDISLPHRATTTVAAWIAAHKRPKLIACPVIDLMPDGTLGEIIDVADLANIHSLHDWLKEKPFVIGAGHAWHRSLWYDFPPLPETLNHEDQIAGYRSAMLDAGITLKIPLVHYRRGGATSQIKLRSTVDWLRKRHLDAVRDEAFWAQMIMDAEGFPLDPNDLKLINKNLSRCQLERKMIEASSIRDQLRLFLKKSDANLPYRLRILITTLFAGIFFKLKIKKCQPD